MNIIKWTGHDDGSTTVTISRSWSIYNIICRCYDLK